MGTGGDALAVGVWYQTLGAAAALGGDWSFAKGTGNSVYGESSGLWESGPRQVLLEYFDMDAAVRGAAGLQFVQFKVTSQQEPPKFTWKDVREILRNATHAILKHEAHSSEPITGFVLATNRPPGQFTLLQHVINTTHVDVNDAASFAAFAASPAPTNLFPPKKGSGDESDEDADEDDKEEEEEEEDKIALDPSRTMYDLAKRFTDRKPGCTWGFTAKKRREACLKAMALFAFAAARPTEVRDALHRQLYKWGFLPGEVGAQTESILGTLQALSGTHEGLTEESVMRRLLQSQEAVPITARYIWEKVVRDLREYIILDEPTPRPLSDSDIADWMRPRSELLQGLPHTFTEGATVIASPAGSHPAAPSPTPRIFVFVGPGGVGKSILMTQLLTRVAGTLWDWEADTVIETGTFIGCPIYREAEVDALAAIPNSLKKWAGRREEFDQPGERLALAYEVSREGPTVWFGIDGLDEISDDQILNLARRVAHYARDHTNVRFVLSTRPDQFEHIKMNLSGGGLLGVIRVDEFTDDESREAVLLATERHLRMSQPPSTLLAAGNATGVPSPGDAFAESPLDQSIRQPLFVGVLHRVYKESGIEIIQRAYDGDPDGLLNIAGEYVFDYCERAARRLKKASATPPRVFRAIRQLAKDVTNPTSANSSYWRVVCERHFDDQVEWGALYQQCVNSGLIRRVEAGGGAFEWRHPFVGKYLPEVKERPTWE